MNIAQNVYIGNDFHAAFLTWQWENMTWFGQILFEVGDDKWYQLYKKEKQSVEIFSVQQRKKEKNSTFDENFWM